MSKPECESRSTSPSARYETFRRGIKRTWWNAERFGFTPLKLPLRGVNRKPPAILCVSIPKAGTHLLERALCKHPRLYRPLRKTVDEANLPADGFAELIKALKPGQVIFSHLFYSQDRADILRASGVRCVFMVRDLRDVVISEANYLSATENHIYHQAFTGIDSSEEKIVRALEGFPDCGLPSMSQLFEGFSGWLDSDAHLVRFEDLIGESGGGSVNNQRSTLLSLYDYLGMALAPGRLDKLASNVFSSASPTFNRGKTGQWAEFIDGALKQRFKRLTGDAIVRYGYEDSTFW